jgi:hypothetical protein
MATNAPALLNQARTPAPASPLLHHVTGHDPKVADEFISRLIVACDGHATKPRNKSSISQQRYGVGAYQDNSFISGSHEIFAGLLKTLSDVHGISYDRVIYASWRADVADENGSGMDADPDPDRVLSRPPTSVVVGSQGANDSEGRPHGGISLIVTFGETAPRRHGGITDELVDEPTLPLDADANNCKMLIEHVSYFTHRRIASDLGEVNNIGKQHGH